jgi:hypothetical protein
MRGYNIIYTNHVEVYIKCHISQTLTKAKKASTSNNLFEKNNNAPDQSVLPVIDDNTRLDRTSSSNTMGVVLLD